MALVAVESAPGALVELDAGAFGGSPETLTRLLESQRELFHSQIEQLQQLVVVQCKLTGVNPLAQEMAAGALSIKIGKRPRDLLNPKAVKYMQSIFSIKDTIGKKETREISALCGVTVSQVREYFSGQRSRVRKLVRLSRDKATRSEASKLLHENCTPHVNNSLPDEATVAVAEHRLIADDAQLPVKAGIPNVIGNLQLPMNIAILPVAENAGILATSKNSQEDIVASSDLKKVEETHLSSLQEEIVPGVDFDDKKFIDDIFNLMGKEQTFSGQVKLMEWILRIQNIAVLNWFLTKGGLTILETWLSQSAVEEQTTVIHLILKVFCHLPLQKALPMQLSTILQAVNKLRFYRFSDISHRAKVLLSRWSKQLIRSQALKKPFNSSSRTARNKQRIGDVLVDESWQSKVEIPEDILYLTGNGGSNRMAEPKQELKLLPAPGARVASSAKSKERRKVLLVEQPDRRSAGRTTQVARIASLNHSRPISADDIQKAKMRAMFMQDKYGKTDATNSGNKLEKKDVHIVSASRIPEVQQVINEDDQQRVSVTDSVPNETETTIDPKQSSSSTLQLDKLSCCKIQWQNPPAVRICSQWCVAVGEKSKEVEVQTQRNKREKETLYSCPQDIPLNPKEPWDFEMDFDDSLTPEIPIEQAPEADVSEGPSCSHHDNSGCVAVEEPQPDATLAPLSSIVTPTSTQTPSSGASQPDMELLAVLLKNPDLVLALTSNQGKTLTSDEMVALLDMLKSNGNLLAGLTNGGSAQSTTSVSSRDVRQYEPEPTSLPSPTPPSDIERMAWRSQFPTSRAPVLQPFSVTGVVSTSILSQSPVPSSLPPEVAQARAHGVVLPQAPATIPSMPPSAIANIPTPQNHSALNVLANRHPLPPAPLQTTTPSMYSIHQSASSEPSLPASHRPVSDPSLTAALARQEFYNHSSHSLSTFQTSVLHPSPLKSQTPVALPEPPKFPPKAASWSATAVNAASSTGFLQRDTTPDQWIGRSSRLADVPASNQHFFSNQNNYNPYSRVPTQQPGRLTVHPADTSRRIADGSTSGETWSPDNDPGRSQDSRGRWNHHTDPPRRDNGWNDKPEWSSRQMMHGDRNHHRSGGSSRRWRERERDYGRRR